MTLLWLQQLNTVNKLNKNILFMSVFGNADLFKCQMALTFVCEYLIGIRSSEYASMWISHWESPNHDYKLTTGLIAFSAFIVQIVICKTCLYCECGWLTV